MKAVGEWERGIEIRGKKEGRIKEHKERLHLQPGISKLTTVNTLVRDYYQESEKTQ